MPTAGFLNQYVATTGRPMTPTRLEANGSPLRSGVCFSAPQDEAIGEVADEDFVIDLHSGRTYSDSGFYAVRSHLGPAMAGPYGSGPTGHPSPLGLLLPKGRTGPS